jgi:glycosyltransferase involved in cell wall biosynthesis
MTMRIALVTPEYPGCGRSFGVGAYVATLAQALRASGCDTVVLVAADRGWWRVDGGGAPAARGGMAVPFAIRPALAAPWLRRELGAWRPHVVESANWGGLGGPLRGPWRRVVRLSTPTAILPRDSSVSRLVRPIHAAWEAAAVRSADLVIADSAAMADLGRRVYRRASDAVIPHAWDGPIAAEPSAGRDVLFVGRLEPRKGIDLLLAAWNGIRRRHPGRTLHLVGRDPSGFGARMLARHGVDQVIAHGQLTDGALAALRPRCGIQVVPSRFESFGLVVLEAWAAGLAVVASAAGALPEVVGDAGIVTPGTALAAALDRLLGDPARRDALVWAGRRRLLDRHAPRRFAEATLAAYHG